MIGAMESIGRIYTGRVQGVGFRMTAQSIAHHLHVSGWVRNEPDGTVRLVACAQGNTLTDFEREIQTHLGRSINAITPFEPDGASIPANDTPFEIRR